MRTVVIGCAVFAIVLVALLYIGPGAVSWRRVVGWSWFLLLPAAVGANLWLQRKTQKREASAHALLKSQHATMNDIHAIVQRIEARDQHPPSTMGLDFLGLGLWLPRLWGFVRTLR